MGNKNRAQFLEEKKISILLLTQSIPMIIARFTDIVYNMIDTFFVSYLGITAIAGVAVTLPLTNTIGAITAMFGPPAGSYISRLLGANEKKLADKTASMSLLIVIIMSTSATFVAYLFLSHLLILYGAIDEVYNYAFLYMSVLLYSIPLSAINKMLSNVIRSEGNSKLVMASSITSSVLDALLDAFFILVLNWGITGVAFATVLAYFSQTFIYLIYFLTKRSFIKIKLKYMRIYPNILKQLLMLGIPSTLSDTLKNVVAGLFNNLASQYGSGVLAAMGIVNQLTKMYDSFVIGFNQGLRIIVGYNYGAKKYQRVKQAIMESVKWRFIIATILGVSLIFVGKPIVHIFIKDNDNAVYLATLGVILTYLVSPFKVAFSSVAIHFNISIGKPISSSVVTLFQEVILLIPVFLLMEHFFGELGVFLTKPLVYLLAGFLGLYMIKKSMKEINLKIGEINHEKEKI